MTLYDPVGMIPTFTGTPYEVGRALGQAQAGPIRDLYTRTRDGLPASLSEERLRKLLLTSWHLSQRAFPEVCAELKGMAEGAKIRLLDLFLSWYEELLDPAKMSGCTDIVALGEATKDGKILLGHNNDMEGGGTAAVFRLAVQGQPTVLSFAYDGAPSAGTNSAGLVCGGNTLTNIDIRWGGIPRLVLFRAALSARTIEEALRITLHPLRASSYNDVFADDRGRVIDAEGSATAASVLSPKDGLLSHSNHYVIPEMVPYEGKRDPVELRDTYLRKDRSRQLLEASPGPHTVETFRRILSDHVGAPDASICLHARGKTVFSIIAEPERRRVWYCEGNPCTGQYEPIDY